MKIEFQDKGYIEFQKHNTSDNIVISIYAKDYSNPLKKINNSVSLTKEQFNELIKEFIMENKEIKKEDETV